MLSEINKEMNDNYHMVSLLHRIGNTNANELARSSKQN